MDKNEFERIKAEEKAHLRKLRALKQQHRGATRKASILGAMKGLSSSGLDATHDEMTGSVMRKAAETEARFEMAAESAAAAERAAADAERLRQSDAEALVRQMKAEMGTDAPSPLAEPGRADASRSDARRSDASREDEARAAAGSKTIGRTPPPDEPAPPPERGAKSIGRPRRS